jgi:hypothetical protein
MLPVHPAVVDVVEVLVAVVMFEYTETYSKYHSSLTLASPPVMPNNAISQPNTINRSSS